MVSPTICFLIEVANAAVTVVQTCEFGGKKIGNSRTVTEQLRVGRVAGHFFPLRQLAVVISRDHPAQHGAILFPCDNGSVRICVCQFLRQKAVPNTTLVLTGRDFFVQKVSAVCIGILRHIGSADTCSCSATRQQAK